ncbi:MAG: hypothetical protein HS110_15335 [Zoogloeaceae bacterium]|jgi:Predicted nucleic-acid-binding protein containing a Zn-ribbon|nr:hypothetical protein [Zoogloeaceae bacterium]
MNKEQILRSAVRLPFRFAVGAAASRFYRALRDEKTLYGTRCDGCGKVSVPARSFCGHCRRKPAQWVALPDYGTLVGWCDTPTPAGFLTALIQLQGADNLLMHRVPKGIPLRQGMAVRARWRESRNGAITDIKCFEPDLGEKT